MNKLLPALLLALVCIASSGCGKEQQAAAPAQPAAPSSQAQGANGDKTATPADAAPATEESTPTAPAETVSETDDAPTEPAPSGVQPSLRLATATSTPATSERFREGTNYRKVVPAQPTSAPPGKVEVAEVFWYGCGHCFQLDSAIETWRSKGKPAYVEFQRIPAMWNDTLRMHARLYYTTEALGKLDELHGKIFREIHVNGNPLSTLEKMQAFFKQQGVSPEDFQKTFSSFAVESKLQRADFLNRRFQVDSVPRVIVNGKYVTDLEMAGGERELFDVVDELAAHEHGG